MFDDILSGVNDFIQNARSGKITEAQLGNVLQQNGVDMERAGATPDQIASASQEIRNFVNNYHGGTAENPTDGSDGSLFGLPLWMWIAALGVALVFFSSRRR